MGCGLYITTISKLQPLLGCCLGLILNKGSSLYTGDMYDVTDSRKSNVYSFIRRYYVRSWTATPSTLQNSAKSGFLISLQSLDIEE